MPESIEPEGLEPEAAAAETDRADVETTAAEQSDADEAAEAELGEVAVPAAVPLALDDARVASVVSLALAGLGEITDQVTVGPLVGAVDEGADTVTLQFDCLLAGYPGWRWTVSIAALPDTAPTVLETELLPGDGALVAPDWVPWAERLADWRAAQAAAELEAGDEDDDSDDDDVDDEDLDDLDDHDLDDHIDDELVQAALDDAPATDAAVDESEDDAGSAVPAGGVDQADEPEADAAGAGRKKRFARWRRKRSGGD